MAFISYTEKLQDVRWQKVRLSVFDRDKWTCQATDCKLTTKTLHVHHLEYIPDILPWDYPMDMLTTLCDSCHKKEDKREGLEKHLAATLKMKGFLVCDLLALSCRLEQDKTFLVFFKNILRQYQNG